MPSEILKLTAQIVTSHASMTEISPGELVEEIKQVYNALTFLEGSGGETAISETAAPEMKKPPIPLNQVVRDKYVVCLECGKKFRTLKAHLRKAHSLKPKEYAQKYNLDLKKYPLVCKEYSEVRSKMAKEKGLGAGLRGRRKSAGTA